MKRRPIFLRLAVVILFLIGFGILSYPTVSDLWNRYRNRQLIASYSEAVQAYSDAQYTIVLEEARAYNLAHTQNVITDAFENEEYVLTHPYDTLLNPGGDGIMGSIEIPKIHVNLAIYHGTGASSLQQGAGHLEGTSLPIGGKGTHAVISAHRGLPSAKLFTDADQLEEGDIFYIHVLQETLVYRVDQILTVLPDETAALAIDPDKDFVTLVTCTPYGANTHRLLIRGERTETVQGVPKADTAQFLKREYPLLLMGVGLLIFLIFVYFLFRRERRTRGE